MNAEGAAILDDVLFEDLLSEAANAPDDIAAQAALASHLQEVLDTGDLERVMAVAMIVGATACMHPHLEDAASMFGQFGVDDPGHEDADHDHERHTNTSYRTYASWVGRAATVPNRITIRDLINKVFTI